MTDKELNEQYWLLGVDDAMVTAEALFKSKIYHHALFYCQLAIEKQLKGIIARQKNAPPIHNLAELAKIAGLPLTLTRTKELLDITDFNLAARYDIGPTNLKHIANRKYFLKWYKITKEILSWLKKL